MTAETICNTELYCLQLTAYKLTVLQYFFYALAVFIALASLMFIYNYFLRSIIGRPWR